MNLGLRQDYDTITILWTLKVFQLQWVLICNCCLIFIAYCFFVVFTTQYFKSMHHPNHCIHQSDRKAKQMTNIKRFLTQYWRQVFLVNWWRHSFGDFFFWSHGQYGLVTDCLQLVLSSVIDAASLRSLPHHFKMSSIYLRAGRPGRRSPWTIPNNNVFNSRSSGILQICPNIWSFLIRIVSTTVSFHCTTAPFSSLVLQSCHFTAKFRL